MRFLLEMFSQGIDQILAFDGELMATLWRTVVFAAVSTALALALGLPVGVRIADGATRARRAGLILANAGLGLPPVVVGVYLALILLPGSLLGWLDLTYTLPAIVLAQVILALPIVIALTASAVRALPPGLNEQARAFGAGRTSRWILLIREARVGVLTAALAAFGSALAEVGAVVIVGGNMRGQTNTLASTILLDLSAGDAASATAVALLLVGLMVLLTLIPTILQLRTGRDHGRDTGGPRRAVTT